MPDCWKVGHLKFVICQTVMIDGRNVYSLKSVKAPSCGGIVPVSWLKAKSSSSCNARRPPSSDGMVLLRLLFLKFSESKEVRDQQGTNEA